MAGVVDMGHLDMQDLLSGREESGRNGREGKAGSTSSPAGGGHGLVHCEGSLGHAGSQSGREE